MLHVNTESVQNQDKTQNKDTNVHANTLIVIPKAAYNLETALPIP